MMCGEYGDRLKRPHYHAIIFGLEVPDRKLFKENRFGDPIYSSSWLDNIWSLGYTTTAAVTWDTCAYVARYTMKKINGAEREKINPETGLRPYDRVHRFTGEIVEVLPEFSTQSRRPGIGKDHYLKYAKDIYTKDRIYSNGCEVKPPRYYDSLFELDDPERFLEIKEERSAEREKHMSDNTRARLAERETVKKAQISMLKRNEEHDNEISSSKYFRPGSRSV